MTETVYGFIYSTLNEQDALQPQHLGQLVEAEVRPWLTHHDVSTVYIKQWPGQLWFVEVVKAFSQTNSYSIPALAVRPLKQLPCSLLFGSAGEGVCQLLDRICQLTLVQVEQLATLANPLSEEAYANVWNNWLQQTDNSTMHYEADHTGTLAIGEGENASPIYNGLLTVSDLVHHRAKELMGDAAFIKSSINDEDVYLTPMWNKACSVLLQTAMGLGAEKYIFPKELPLLLLGWKAINKN